MAFAIAGNEVPDDEVTTTRSGITRSPARLALSSEVTLSSESQFFAGLTGDVSEGGVFIETYQDVVRGRRVVVSLSLPTAELELLGEVVWLRDACDGTTPGIGVAFEELSLDARAAIDAFCRLRAPLYHELATD